MSESRPSFDGSQRNLNVPEKAHNAQAVDVIQDESDHEGSHRFTIDNLLRKNNDESVGSLIKDQSARKLGNKDAKGSKSPKKSPKNPSTQHSHDNKPNQPIDPIDFYQNPNNQLDDFE
jgi:hypothetical protein